MYKKPTIPSEFNLRDYLLGLNYPIDKISIPEHNPVEPQIPLPLKKQKFWTINFNQLLKMKLTKPQRNGKGDQIRQQIRYDQVQLSSNLCAGYLWYLRKSRHNRRNIWDFLKRRQRDSSLQSRSSGSSQVAEKESNTMVYNLGRSRWERKWFKCDLLEQKVSVFERWTDKKPECEFLFCTDYKLIDINTDT